MSKSIENTKKLSPAKCEMIMIGGSAGSLGVLLYLFGHLKKNFGLPVVVVVHRAATSDNTLVKLLANKTDMTVQEAAEKETVAPGNIYIAPPDYHLLLENDRTFALDYSEKVNYSRPSIDVSFTSAADVYGAGLVGILLSGANADGAEGLKTVAAAGGTTIIQDPATAEVSYMPGRANSLQQPSYIFSPLQMAEFLNGI